MKSNIGCTCSNKVMAEVTLHCEEKWAIMFMGKVIALDKVGVHDNFQFSKSHYFLKFTIQPLPRPILIY
jgi:hypothetical protein